VKGHNSYLIFTLFIWEWFFFTYLNLTRKKKWTTLFITNILLFIFFLMFSSCYIAKPKKSKNIIESPKYLFKQNYIKLLNATHLFFYIYLPIKVYIIILYNCSIKFWLINLVLFLPALHLQVCSSLTSMDYVIWKSFTKFVINF